ncbi:hypothetical protein ANCCAN_19251, partial [Ancylostoma caninum]
LAFTQLANSSRGLICGVFQVHFLARSSVSLVCPYRIKPVGSISKQPTFIQRWVFTDRCRDPGSERGMPTVPCSTVCVSLLEPDIEAGVFIGYKHIRGCMDRVLRHGFNQTALRTHRFHHHNQCRTLSRAHLFNPARATDPPAIGDVQLCSCYGDRCNGSNQAHLARNLASLTITFILAVFLQ